MIQAKPGQLKMRWSRKENDIMFSWGKGTPRCDASFLCMAFTTKLQVNGKSIQDELKDRGYDITTIQFSIMLKEGTPNG